MSQRAAAVLLAVATGAAAGTPLAGCVSADAEILIPRPAVDAGAPMAEADGAPPGSGEDPTCPITCPPNGPGSATLCGLVLDLETSQPIADEAPEVRIFDLIELQLNPQNAAPRATVTPDACGGFAIDTTGLPALSVLQTGATDSTGPFRSVASLYVLSSLILLPRINVYALRAATEVQWSASAGLTGAGFADRGARLAIFVNTAAPPVEPLPGTPFTDVELTVNDGSPEADTVYYFADDEPIRRSSLAPGRQSTGPSGAGIVLAPGQLGVYGGDLSDCTFVESPLFNMPGTIQVQQIDGYCF